ncbi:MAG: hypothetical protein HQM04_07350 [Magnetococcales bacterium]|nr:hypothetical protein [Magnetococcales bacterium]MBF0114846.1 hypothetical protein [Magnetococcales bacterium]
MMDGRVAASQEVVATVTRDNFNLVWATIDWAIRAERFRLPAASIKAFRTIAHELQENDAVLQQLNAWMEENLRPETCRRIFGEIRRAQFEAAKGAVQITISEESYKLLRSRKKHLFGPYRGSMEVTIRHLLHSEQRALPNQAFRLLELYRQRHNLPNVAEAVRVLIDHAEMACQATSALIDTALPPETPPLTSATPLLPPLPTTVVDDLPTPIPTEEPDSTSTVCALPPAPTPATEPVWGALFRCWIPN